MIRNLARAVTLSLFAALAAQGAQPTPTPPSIALQPTAVVVSGITPGGTVTLCGEAEEPGRFSNNFIHRDAFLEDKNRTGEIRVAVADGVPRMSIWFAADNSSGTYSLAAPPNSPYQAVDVPANALRRNGKGELFKIDMAMAIFDLLLVRPGGGSWQGTIADGGKLDDERRPNGRSAVVFTRLTPLGRSGPPPEKLKKGDILFGVDPIALRYFVVTVGQE